VAFLPFGFISMHPQPQGLFCLAIFLTSFPGDALFALFLMPAENLETSSPLFSSKI